MTSKNKKKYSIESQFQRYGKKMVPYSTRASVTNYRKTHNEHQNCVCTNISRKRNLLQILCKNCIQQQQQQMQQIAFLLGRNQVATVP